MTFISLETALGKRPCADGDLNIVCEAKLVKITPSHMGWPSTYKPMQKESSQRILDDHPMADPVPLASLLYHGFGHFMVDPVVPKGKLVKKRKRNLKNLWTSSQKKWPESHKKKT